MSAEEIVKPFIKQLLGDIEDPELEEKVKLFYELACREWAEWIAGIYRPTSMGELNADRIFRIYAEIKIDVPTVEELVMNFDIPAGRARYLISNLKYGGYTELRKIMRDKLTAILTKETTGKEDSDDISPFIKKTLLEELRLANHILMHNRSFPEGPRYQSIREQNKSNYGAECYMKVLTARRIIDELKSVQ